MSRVELKAESVNKSHGTCIRSVCLSLAGKIDESCESKMARRSASVSIIVRGGERSLGGSSTWNKYR